VRLKNTFVSLALILCVVAPVRVDWNHLSLHSSDVHAMSGGQPKVAKIDISLWVRVYGCGQVTVSQLHALGNMSKLDILVDSDLGVDEIDTLDLLEQWSWDVVSTNTYASRSSSQVLADVESEYLAAGGSNWFSPDYALSVEGQVTTGLLAKAQVQNDRYEGFGYVDLSDVLPGDMAGNRCRR
jgi:hypothetical protein